MIENPVESSPPPPPPPPLPPLPLLSPAWNALVATPTTTTIKSSAIDSTSMPAATTVMTITIAENPTALPTYPPVRFSYRETYGSKSNPYADDLYSSCRVQARGRSYGDPEGASPSVRRTDKSGLLGITESEASGLRGSIRSPRLLSGVSNVASGIVSPRRLECIGQLDPVLEVPGQVTRANVAPGARSLFPVTCASVTREGVRTDGCETLSVVALGRPIKSASFDSLDAKYGGSCGAEMDLEGIDSCSSGYGSSFRFQEGCETRARTLGRLSRFPLARSDRDAEIGEVSRYSETCCNFPFTVRAATAFSGFEGTSSLPSTRATTVTTTSTTTVAFSAMAGTASSKEEGAKCNLVAGEERAEAEGCEHGATRLKDGEPSQRGDDQLLDNDAIQTLRVIILSEQL